MSILNLNSVMQIPLLFSVLVDTDIPIFPRVSKRKQEPSGRELTAAYKYNDQLIPVSCTYSPCRTKCIFSSTELGEVMFHRSLKIFLSSTRPVEDNYINFLGRTLHQWEKHFDDFDLRPYLQSLEEPKK
jgi:hypothetical protein